MVFVASEVLPHPSQRNVPAKLRAVFNGPFEVIAVDADRNNVVIKLAPPFRKSEFTVHIEHVKKFTRWHQEAPSVARGKANKDTYVPPVYKPLTNEEEEFLTRREEATGSRGATLLEDEYVVERIVDSRGDGDEREFLVQWEGYEEPTWEPQENILSETLIAEYAATQDRG